MSRPKAIILFTVIFAIFAAITVFVFIYAGLNPEPQLNAGTDISESERYTTVEYIEKGNTESIVVSHPYLGAHIISNVGGSRKLQESEETFQYMELMITVYKKYLRQEVIHHHPFNV